MIEQKMICDACGREIPPMTYYVGIKPRFLSRSGTAEMQESAMWLICDDCLREIGRRVREQTEPIDFEIEVTE